MPAQPSEGHPSSGGEMNGVDVRRSQSPKPPARRLRGVEGLRGLAASLVLIYHVGTVLTPGTVRAVAPFIGWFDRGLTLFFVLSGFLLFRPFAAALLGYEGRPSVCRYLRNRALRIWPAYIVVLLAVDAVSSARLPGAVPFDRQVAVGRLDPGTLLMDLFLVQTYVPDAMRTGLEVAWTLTVEVAFYVLLPLLFVAALRIDRGRGSVPLALMPAVLLLTAGVGTRLVVAAQAFGGSPTDAWLDHWGDRWSAALSRSLLPQADLFAFGMVAAVVVVLNEHGRLPLTGIARSRIWVLVLLSVASGVLLPAVVGESAFGAACAALVVVVVIPARDRTIGRMGYFLELPPVRGLGLASFSVYLWHLALIRWLVGHRLIAPDTVWGLVIDVGLVAAGTGVLATITYLAVERPAMRLRFPRRRVRTQTPAPT